MLKITVVIPCFNMEAYIEDTLLSVVSQRYPKLELIVVDGGSTDGTIEILEKYRPQISTLISEPDEGQYFAVNKGLRLATGQIVCWLNADDIYFPWTLKMVNHVFLNHPEISWISGATSTMREDGLIKSLGGKGMVKSRRKISRGYFRQAAYGYLQNEGMFWRREVQEACGLVDTKYRLAGDFELWTRFAKKYRLLSVLLPLASFRTRNDSRSIALGEAYEKEVGSVISQLPGTGKQLCFQLPHDERRNQIRRMLSFNRGLIYYWNPLNRKYVLREARTNMLFWSVKDMFRFTLDILFNRG